MGGSAPNTPPALCQHLIAPLNPQLAAKLQGAPGNAVFSWALPTTTTIPSIQFHREEGRGEFSRQAQPPRVSTRGRVCGAAGVRVPSFEELAQAPFFSHNHAVLPSPSARPRLAPESWLVIYRRAIRLANPISELKPPASSCKRNRVQRRRGRDPSRPVQVEMERVRPRGPKCPHLRRTRM